MKLYPEAAKQFVRSGTCRTPSSAASYEHTLRHLQSVYPRLELHQFTTAHLTEYCMSNSPSPNTMRTRRGRISSFFGWATFHGLIDQDPSAGLKFTVKVKGGGVREHNWMSEQQFAELVRACDDTLYGRRLRLILLLGTMAGMRRFEIPTIKWSDLSADMTRLTVVGKGNKLVQLGVPPQLASLLRDWRRVAPADAVYVLPKSTSHWGDGHFTWSCQMSPENVAKVVKEHGERHGVEVRTHDLRRSYAGILDQRGVAVQDIQKLMRHENLGTTSIYLEKNPARAAALADEFTLEL
jgi:integrase/recombinase XerD